MSRSFFNIQDGADFPDKEGTELPDMKAVRSEAICASAEMLRDNASYWDGTEWRMNVVDDDGVTVSGCGSPQNLRNRRRIAAECSRRIAEWTSGGRGGNRRPSFTFFVRPPRLHLSA
jgi:hypothetical protein